MKPALAFSMLLLLAACGGEATDPAVDAKAAELPAIAPAIVPPDEIADPNQPPSYEVAIATAAAAHNASKERCAKQPESVRAQCEQEANATFSEAKSGIDRLRGNQQ